LTMMESSGISLYIPPHQHHCSIMTAGATSKD